MKQDKEKYSLKNSIHSFTELLIYIWKKNKTVYAFTLLYFPTYILANLLQVYLPKAVLAELENEQTVLHFISTLTLIFISLFTALFFRDKSKVKIENGNTLISLEMNYEYAQKFLYVEYPYLENPDFLFHRDSAKTALYGRGRDSDLPCLKEFLKTLNTMIASLGTALIYIIIISRLSPLLTAAILATSLGTMWSSLRVGRPNYGNMDLGEKAIRKLDYISSQVGNFSLAKDVRLYHMEDWLLRTAQKCRQLWLYSKSIQLKRDASIQLSATFFMGIQNLIVYWFLLAGIFHSEISLSDLVFYAGSSTALSNAFISWSNQTKWLHRLSIDYKKLCEFLSFGENEKQITLPAKKEQVTISLDHVSFRFPGMERDLLHDLNFTVNCGERLAIVGINGAGKTTLMKLICGLLTPTEGRILINGADLHTIPPHERYRWFSCAFQDVSFLPLTIAENISMRPLEETDEQRVWNCLSMAGIREKIENTPDKLYSFMEKDIRENAVDFSGGERQKLILARSLYKDASVLILDEPTAALDPLAENDIYLKYAAFSEGKTSFFVSHRLSSTRFCDKILLLDGGSIKEEGTHDALLAKGGLYAQMFTLQSHYYKEEAV